MVRFPSISGSIYPTSGHPNPGAFARRLLPVMACFTAACCGLAVTGATPAAEPPAHGQAKTFRAGAAAVDVTPVEFPVVVSGMFTERVAQRAHDRLYARALVLDDGNTRLAIVVVDNLMLPRDLLDEAKTLAHKATGIPAERMLISATHTHSAPSAMGALGSDAGCNDYLSKPVDRATLLDVLAGYLPG